MASPALTNTVMTPPREYLLELATAEWTDLDLHLRGKSAFVSGTRLRMLEYTKGYRARTACAAAHTGYVVEGALALDFSGRTLVVHEGRGFDIPAGDKHIAEPLSERVLVLLIERTPEAPS